MTKIANGNTLKFSKKYLLITIVFATFTLIAFMTQRTLVKKSIDKLPSQVDKITKTIGIDEVSAIEKVKNLPKVKEYLVEVPNAQVVIDHEDPETNSWVVHVFEIKNGHTATFNWYQVNKKTGKIDNLFGESQ